MNFEEGSIYHIYNQGNNRRKTFLNVENYHFFLRKIKTHILPYADILAWCLMPNHIHFMVLVNEVELPVDKNQGLTSNDSQDLTPSQALTMRTFNYSIGIMLRSYTRAFNNRNGFSGKLFREKTKAECVNCPDGITPPFFVKNGITHITITDPEKQYPQICFDYIHQNPVKAKLVSKVTDWEFSSARDYAGMRDGKLVNKVLAEEYVNTKL
jgi:putative transposase